VRWAVDLRGKTATLLLVLLAAHGQQITYVPGRSVNRAAEGYRGEGKTDAKDALIIADMARVRRDFTTITIPAEQVCTLRLLTANRRDLIADRVRLVNRIRDLLCGISPALERAFDYARSKGAVILLTHYQTPSALRRTGVKRLTTWLERRKVRSPQKLAEGADGQVAQSGHGARGGVRHQVARLLGRPLNERRLRTILAIYTDHYNRCRPHQSHNDLPQAAETDHTATTILLGDHIRRTQLLCGLINGVPTNSLTTPRTNDLVNRPNRGFRAG
jgi:hypothetical protein